MTWLIYGGVGLLVALMLGGSSKKEDSEADKEAKKKAADKAAKDAQDALDAAKSKDADAKDKLEKAEKSTAWSDGVSSGIADAKDSIAVKEVTSSAYNNVGSEGLALKWHGNFVAAYNQAFTKRLADDGLKAPNMYTGAKLYWISSGEEF